ncbi:MAG TPA: endonuclease domain-containing protein [Thermodesulfobacteriota bacterium]
MTTIRAQALRKNPTDAERKLWAHLRLLQLGGYKFRRQHSLGPYIVDFICIEKKLIIEVDGGQHDDNKFYDSKRDKWLENKGFRVLRFWNNEVLTYIENVKEVIAGELGLE